MLIRDESYLWDTDARIECGDHCRDIYSGIEGIATTRTEHLGGSTQISLECGIDGGEIVRHIFEEGRLARRRDKDALDAIAGRVGEAA